VTHAESVFVDGRSPFKEAVVLRGQNRGARYDRLGNAKMSA
jgi:hypothetical protein